jgi:hypothetical protein
MPIIPAKKAETGGSHFKASQHKKLLRPPISTNKPFMVVSIYNPSHEGSIGRRITI